MSYLRLALAAIALLLTACAAFAPDCADYYVCPTVSVGVTVEIPLSRGGQHPEDHE